MDIEVKIIKDIPVKQIEKFEDRVVYYTAFNTRNYVKTRYGYPYRTGNLRKSEIAAPIIGTNKEYGLLPGTKYAKKVYNWGNVNWTNKSTIPHWYHTAFRTKGYAFLTDSVIKALKELK